MVALNMLFDHTTSNANTTSAAVISATEWANASASGGSAISVVSRVATMSGRRGLTRSATRPPAIAPTPNPAEMQPQADAPPSERAAMTGPSTKNAGSVKLPQACAHSVIQYQGRIASSCQPSPRSARNDAGGGIARGGTRSSARQTRLTEKVAAATANSQRVPKTAMSTPPAAGPPMLKKLCGSPSRLLACWSSAVGTVSGTSAIDAGLKNEVAAP